MILIVTSSFDPHADLLIDAANKLEAPFYRLNTDLSGSLWTIDMRYDKQDYHWDLYDRHFGRIVCDSRRVQSLIIRRPTIPNFGDLEVSPSAVMNLENEFREFYRSFLHNLVCYKFNPLFSIIESEYKPVQLQLAPSFGFRIPPTLISNRQDSLREKVAMGPTIMKGMDSRGFEHEHDFYSLDTVRFSAQDIQEDNDSPYYRNPLLLQTEIEKKFEVRTIVIADDVLSFRIDSQSVPGAEVDWRVVDYKKHGWEPIETPPAVVKSCKKFLLHFGLNSGSFDFIVRPDEAWVFLECNPNGQWGWLQERRGIPLSERIIDCMLHERRPKL